MQPDFKVLADSQDITSKIAERLISLEITDKAGVKSDQATITIDDRDEALEIPRRGVKLEISLGYVGQSLVRMGTYVVDTVELEGPVRVMTIRANATDMTSGIKAPKERSWHDITFGDLVKKIAQENKLTPSIPSDLASRNLEHVDQTESDMQLLSRICSEQGATFKVADGRLIVADHAAGKTASGKTMDRITIDAKNCDTWNADVSECEDYKSVKALWHNLETGAQTEEVAGSGEPSMTLKKTYKSADAAKRAAESKFKLLKRAKQTLRVNGYIGDPYMSAERIASVVGFRKGLDGLDWVINDVTHSLSDSGYTNTIALETKE